MIRPSKRDFAQLFSRARMILQHPEGCSHETRLRLIDDLARAEGLFHAHDVPWDIDVHIARVDHRAGTNINAALSQRSLMAQLAAYCCDSWSELNDKRDYATRDDEEIVRIYFSEHPSERLSTMCITLAGSDSDAGPPPRVRLYLTISTGHVRPSTGDLLDIWSSLIPEQRPLGVAETGYGWFVLCDPLDDADIKLIPAELVAAITYARDRGCRYLLLDRDADEVGGLEAFDW
ncbi:DUF5983 family protein [Sphingomonas oryzagri]